MSDASEVPPETSRILQTTERPTRLLALIAINMFLEMAADLGASMDGDLIKGLVLMAVIRENLPAAFDSEQSLRCAGHDSPTPDDLRVPTTVYTIAKKLGLNYETTRRHMNRLVEEGHCERRKDGFVAPEHMAVSPAMKRVLTRTMGHMRRMIADLRMAGITDI